MSKIAIVTDSTAYIPQDLLKKYNLTVTPQILIWDEKMYQDGVDILSEEFFKRLKTAKTMATTSQVPPSVMKTTFENLIERDFEVLGIFISAKLSGTMQSALQAREMLGKAGDKVTVIDSNSTSMAMGFQVLTAARAAEDGATLQDLVTLVEKARDMTGVYFAVDTLEFLHRGGRIGGAQRFLGTALNMKPILAVLDGRVDAIERIRTKGKALERVIELVTEKTKGKTPIRLATLHANAQAEAQQLLDKASALLNASESILSEVSPVIANHAGPGTVGLAYMAGM